MKWIFLFIVFAISLTSALTADFDCPDEVTQNVEFTCNLEIFDGEGAYDFKLDLQKDSENIARVYNPEKEIFQSSFYYLKGFIETGVEEDVRIIIEEDGNLDGFIKLRKMSSTESFGFSIKVLKGENTPTEDISSDNSNEDNEEADIVRRSSNSVNKTKESNDVVTGAIVLNSAKSLDAGDEKVLVYESKNSKILKYLPYAFSLFLIILIFFLMKDRNGSGGSMRKKDFEKD